MNRKLDVAVRPRGLARRRFLAAIPAAVAGSLAAPALARQQQAPPRIDPATLDCAEKVFGVDFTAAEEEQAAQGVNRNLASYEQLRQLEIPLDTEPAITFHPYLPGQKPKGGATPGAKIKVTLRPSAAAPSAHRPRTRRATPRSASPSPALACACSTVRATPFAS